MKTYPLIDTALKAVRILKYIGSRVEPVSADEISARFDLKYSSVMTYIATLEAEQMIVKDGSGYVPGMEAARIYAMRRSILNKKQDAINAEKTLLGI